MDKILIAAGYKKINYGTALQAFALQYALKKMGVENYIINTDGLDAGIRKNRRRYYRRHVFDIDLYKAKGGLVKHLLREYFNPTFRQDISLRRKAFQKFRGEKLGLTPPYSNLMNLKEACKDYKAIIVGSDQLWLPVNLYGGFYTLSFAPLGVKLFSYATSTLTILHLRYILYPRA